MLKQIVLLLCSFRNGTEHIYFILNLVPPGGVILDKSQLHTYLSMFGHNGKHALDASKSAHI